MFQGAKGQWWGPKLVAMWSTDKHIEVYWPNGPSSLNSGTVAQRSAVLFHSDLREVLEHRKKGKKFHCKNLSDSVRAAFDDAA